MKIDFFNDKFTLFILLRNVVCPGIRPSNHFLAPHAEDIVDTMKASNQESIFWRTDPDVYTLIKKVGSP